MSSGGSRWAAVTLLGLLTAPSARAGMTVYGLSDVHRLRLEEVSFFVFLLLLCALVFKVLWNHAVKGFAGLPRIKFLQALSVCLILGAATLLILTMISGIREVLTPDAWRKQGTSYRLNDPSQEPARQRSLQHLRTALFEYARNHGGNFPPSDFGSEIPDKLWEAPDQQGTHYVYFGGRNTNSSTAILALEPVVFGEERFVLSASGEIEKLPAIKLAARLATEVKP